jgi:hypothetical protein
MIDGNGTVSTIAGTGDARCADLVGPAINASILSPQGLAFDTDGSLYVASECGVLRIDPQGIESVFATLADH